MTPCMTLKIEHSNYLVENLDDAIKLAEILNRAKPVETRYIEIDGSYQHVFVETEATGLDLFSLSARSEMKAITQSEYEEHRKLRDAKLDKSEDSDAA